MYKDSEIPHKTLPLQKTLTIMKPMLTALAVSFCLLLTAGCGEKDDYLAPPTGLKLVELTPNSATFEWETVKEATNYTWSCDGQDLSAGGLCPPNDPSVTVIHLTPGSSYHFWVRAEDKNRSKPADGGMYPLCSEPVVYDFTTPQGDSVSTLTQNSGSAFYSSSPAALN